MFCMYCGADMVNGAKFCRKCGKPAANVNTSERASASNSGTSAAQQAQYGQLRMLTQSSMKKMAACQGYYCFNCGCYVNRSRANNYGDIKCFQCGAPIIKPNMLVHAGTTLLNYGFLGSLVVAASEAADYTNPEKYIMNYYKSIYYQQTRYPFETVATDKGMMGEYLIDLGYQRFKQKFPHLKTYIFYNLFIPEPNGSFQEIDALIIFGSIIMVIEAKNRGGYFGLSSISDKYWDFTPFGGVTERIYSPLAQNNEHIAALQHYLADNKETSDLKPMFCNFVTLAGKGTLNWNKQGDTLDTIMVGHWSITDTVGFTNLLIEDFSFFEEDMKKSPQERIYNYDDSDAQKIIKALMPIINMSDDVKNARMRDRTGSDHNFGKREYQYFYIEEDGCLPFFFRTNWIHMQIMLPGSNIWIAGYNFVEILDRNTLRWKAYKTNRATWHRIDSYMEMLEVYNCVHEFKLYDYPGKNAQQNRQQNRQQQDDRRDNRNQQNSNQQNSRGGNQQQNSTEEAIHMYFSGCNDLNSLNSRYRSLCKVFHPDGGNGDEETFKKMQAAYEILKEKLSA